jgi:LysM repeat protein
VTRTTALLLAFVAFAAPAQAESGARTHVVYSGQRLGSIAKRYGISVEAICSANDMKPSEALKPGQRLLIPARGEVVTPRSESSRAHISASRDDKRRRNASASEHPEPQNQTHRVESGQRLDSIAKRYGIPVDALRLANGLGSKSLIRPGQVLKIPDKNGRVFESEAATRGYIRAPEHKGTVELIGYNERFHGQLFDRKGKLLPTAYGAASRVLACTGGRPRLDPRLLRLVVEVSDTFGGRPLRVVSGFRTTSFFQDSRHKHSQAIDFSIPGVPNEVVRDYLRKMTNVGVGYYPNSSFVHLDVREYAAYWVDYAGPGEAPRHHHHGPGREELREEEPSDVPDAGERVASAPAAVEGSLPLHPTFAAEVTAPQSVSSEAARQPNLDP